MVYTIYTIYTVYTVYTVLTVLTVLTVYTVFGFNFLSLYFPLGANQKGVDYFSFFSAKIFQNKDRKSVHNNISNLER
jgi:hypothetical protein